MKRYTLQQKFFSFPGGIDAWLAEKETDSTPALVLCFPRRKNTDMSAYRRGADIAMQLRNDPALLTILDAQFDEGEFAFRIVYEFAPDMTPLAEVLEKYAEEEKNPLWIMRAAAEQLESLHKRRLSGHFLGAEAIFVDEENFSVRLAFVGFADAFRAHGAGLRANGQNRSDWTDDIYHLAKCFECDYFGANSEIVRKCCADDKSARPDYPKLLRAMAADIAFRPQYENEIPLMFADKIGNAEEIVEHLNLNDCHVSPWHEKENGKRDCDFCTREYTGIFINAARDEHFYVPHISRRRHAPSGGILRARFRHSPHPERGEFGEYHHLVALGDEKGEAVRKWRLVPAQEKAFLEETAFRAAYIHSRKLGESVNKLAFLLRECADWQKIELLKEKQKRLDVVPLRTARRGGLDVGAVYDITPGRAVLFVKSDKDEIPAAGELRAGGLKVPFAFHWRNGRKICFAAADDFDADSLEKIQAMLESDDSVDVVIAGMPGTAGVLDDARILPEIITRDARGESPPARGELYEDISKEIVPFNRQIEAVGKFERGDMVEPSLGGILATPDVHQPLIVPLVSFDALPPPDKDLNDSQKEAVIGALFQKPLFLIHGPPGTGKTTVIVEIIRQILAENSRARILVCSQTNLAVDNVIERLPDKKGRTAIRKIRLFASESRDKISKTVREYGFDERLKFWIKDAINRSNQSTPEIAVLRKPKSDFARKLIAAKEKAESAEQKRENAIRKIVKEWHAFLRNDDDEKRRMRGNVEGGWLPLKTAFLKSMNVVGATCVHIASSRYRDIFGDAYDCLIMDEAGKATPAESLIPINLARRIVLVGDHKQLPPFVTGEREVWNKVHGESPELRDEGVEDLRRAFGESLFEKLIQSPNMNAAQVMLNMQRRMPKQVGDLISKFFYEGKLQSPDDEEYDRDKRIALPFKRHTGLLFCKTDGRTDRHDNGDSKWRQNQCNAAVVVEILRLIDDKLKGRADVAVIAAYCGQVDLLRKRIKKEHGRQPFQNFSLDNRDPGAIVNTVDGFQGRENAIVIYDIVRSSSGRDNIGFLDEPRRLNVALSRAQKLLIVVGDADFLMNRARPGKERKDDEKPILGEIAEEIQRQGFMFNSLNKALE